MRGMKPDDVYELTGVGDPRLHPDGGRVAYVVWTLDREDNDYCGSIWIAAALGVACGSGHWITVLLALALTLGVLVFGGPIERAFERWLRKGKPAGSEDSDS